MSIQPPSASFACANGPSVTSVRPSCTRIVVAFAGSSSSNGAGVTPGVWLIAPQSAYISFCSSSLIAANSSRVMFPYIWIMYFMAAPLGDCGHGRP